MLNSAVSLATVIFVCNKVGHVFKCNIEARSCNDYCSV